jgi:hypothetical protein
VWAELVEWVPLAGVLPRGRSPATIPGRPWQVNESRTGSTGRRKAMKRALCVGINDYPIAGSDLNGCVNDAKAWAELLVEHYGFAKADVKVLLDAQATKAAVMAGLKDLLKGCAAGDILVFTNSSHGTYVVEKSGDEEKYDEAICPYDCKSNLIIDDELRELFKPLPEGIHLTVISDSCFSGTVTRVLVAPRGQKTPDDRRMRFLNPTLLKKTELKDIYKALSKRKEQYPQSKMKDVLLSGCKDNEYSYDALIDGVYHGAMTYYALQAIRAANYQLTYKELHSVLRKSIDKGGYPQHPQLEGRADNKKLLLFT